MLLPLTRRFLDASLDLDTLKRAVIAATVPVGVDGTARELTGVVHVPSFLAETARQVIEGQVYANGTDLRAVYRTAEVGVSDSELVIPSADTQVPILGELRSALDEVLTVLFDAPVTDHAIQIRVIRPGGSGHPRHVDYAQGFTTSSDATIVPVSLSLPISWGDGQCPPFQVYAQDTTHHQTRPGSLVIFGPRTEHATPAPAGLRHEYLWLVTQAFLLFGSVSRELRAATTRLFDIAAHMCHAEGDAAARQLSGTVIITFNGSVTMQRCAALIAGITREVGESELLVLSIDGGHWDTGTTGDIASVFAVSLRFRVRAR